MCSSPSTSRVTVSAQGMTSHALLEALAGESLELSIEPAPGKPRMLDPTVVAAAVEAEGLSLSVLIGSLVALAARQERTKVVIQGASGARLEVLATATSEEVKTSIDMARQIDVVHLHLAGGGP
jgi:hypothetical protein